MNEILVSVVMPVYNAERYLCSAVESILNQTYSNFEFIIIDDCSTDNSYELLNNFADRDSRIKLFRNEINLKLPKTLNFGLSQANGDYIARMDADDISHEDRLEKQVRFLNDHPDIHVCGTAINLINKEDVVIGKINYPEKSNEIEICMSLYGNVIVHPSVMMRKSIFIDRDVYYLETYSNDAEDYELWIRMLRNGFKFANIGECLLNYRVTESQLSSVNKQKFLLTTAGVIESSLANIISNESIKQYVSLLIQLFYAYPSKIWSPLTLIKINNLLKLIKLKNKSVKLYSCDTIDYYICFVKSFYIYNKITKRLRRILR